MPVLAQEGNVETLHYWMMVKLKQLELRQSQLHLLSLFWIKVSFVFAKHTHHQGPKKCRPSCSFLLDFFDRDMATIGNIKGQIFFISSLSAVISIKCTFCSLCVKNNRFLPNTILLDKTTSDNQRSASNDNIFGGTQGTIILVLVIVFIFICIALAVKKLMQQSPRSQQQSNQIHLPVEPEIENQAMEKN